MYSCHMPCFGLTCKDIYTRHDIPVFDLTNRTTEWLERSQPRPMLVFCLKVFTRRLHLHFSTTSSSDTRTVQSPSRSVKYRLQTTSMDPSWQSSASSWRVSGRVYWNRQCTRKRLLKTCVLQALEVYGYVVLPWIDRYQ